jgi:hypothetical protein
LEAARLLKSEQARLILVEKLARIDPTIDPPLLSEDVEDLDLVTDPDWIKETSDTVAVAMKSIVANGGTDGNLVVDSLLADFRKAHEIQR